jgi:hypothetical protein
MRSPSQPKPRAADYAIDFSKVVAGVDLERFRGRRTKRLRLRAIPHNVITIAKLRASYLSTTRVRPCSRIALRARFEEEVCTSVEPWNGRPRGHREQARIR